MKLAALLLASIVAAAEALSTSDLAKVQLEVETYIMKVSKVLMSLYRTEYASILVGVTIPSCTDHTNILH